MIELDQGYIRKLVKMVLNEYSYTTEISNNTYLFQNVRFVEEMLAALIDGTYSGATGYGQKFEDLMAYVCEETDPPIIREAIDLNTEDERSFEFADLASSPKTLYSVKMNIYDDRDEYPACKASSLEIAIPKFSKMYLKNISH